MKPANPAGHLSGPEIFALVSRIFIYYYDVTPLVIIAF